MGGSLLVTVISECRETGSVTYLTDFKKAPDVEQETAAKNGTINNVQNEITEITVTHKKHDKTVNAKQLR